MSANDAKIIGVLGSSGMGKSSYIKEILRGATAAPRLLWSPLEDTDDYRGYVGGTIIRSLRDAALPKLAAVIVARRAALIVAADGDQKAMERQFDKFCRLAWECKGATVLAEELAGVTQPGYAPPAWRKLTTAGRHRGLTVIGVSQRPALIDKTFLANCSEIRCYHLNAASDCKAMSDILHIDHRELSALPKFHYVHRFTADARNTSGVQSPPKKINRI